MTSPCFPIRIYIRVDCEASPYMLGLMRTKICNTLQMTGRYDIMTSSGLNISPFVRLWNLGSCEND